MAEDVKKSRDAGEVRRRLKRLCLRSDIGRVGTGITGALAVAVLIVSKR